MSLTTSWISPLCEVRESQVNGKGVFARGDISRGERLAIFGGEIMTIDEAKELPLALQAYPLQIEERFLLYMKNATNPEDTDYFNHSCDPNAGIKGQIFLVAMRDIAAGEEIMFDYAMTLSEFVDGDMVLEFPCSCGSPLCRGMVTQSDWRKPCLRERYRGYFSMYIEDRIAHES